MEQSDEKRRERILKDQEAERKKFLKEEADHKAQLHRKSKRLDELKDIHQSLTQKKKSLQHKIKKAKEDARERLH